MRHERRAAALFIVLLMSAVMATLVGAFVMINRQQIAMSADVAARSAAHQACLSGLNYAQGELEFNVAWATVSFPEGRTQSDLPTVNSPLLQIITHGDGRAAGPDLPDPTRNYVEGRVEAPSGEQFTFTLRIVNNLEGPNLLRETALGDVPARSARVHIVGVGRGLTRRLDVVLRKRPFSDSSLASGENLTIASEQPDVTADWTALTRDVTNIVRANGRVQAPDPTNNQMRFRGTRGQVRAGGDIRLGSHSIISDPAYKAEAERRARGVFSASSKPKEIPDLTQEQLRVSDHRISIAPGRYEFTDVINDRYEPIEGDPSHLKRIRTIHKGLRFPGDSVNPGRLIANQNGLVTESVVETAGPSGWIGGPAPELVPNDDAELFSKEVDGKTKSVIAQLSTGNILIPAGLTLECNVPGDLEFAGGTNGVNATIAFGFEADGTKPPKFPAGNQSRYEAIDKMDQAGAAIVARGNVKFGGPAVGLGSVSSEGSLTFSAPAGLMTTPNVAVAVRARGDIQLKPPPKQITPGAALRVDGPIFNSAMAGVSAWPSLETWSTLPTPTRDLLTTSLQSQLVKDAENRALTAPLAWDLMKRELNAGSAPNFSQSPFGAGWTGQLTLDKYLRLREYMRSGGNQASWLDPALNQNHLKNLLNVQIGLYQNWSTENELTLQQFMAQGAVIPDMFFVGLVYAGGKVDVLANKHSFFTEGAVVAKRDIRILDSPEAISVYNRLFLEDIVKRYATATAKLDPVFVNLQ